MIKNFGVVQNGCNCGSMNGLVDDIKSGLSTTFFDEVFPKDSKGNRALVTRVEIDTPSLIKIGVILMATVVIFKKLK